MLRIRTVQLIWQIVKGNLKISKYLTLSHILEFGHGKGFWETCCSKIYESEF
jgi:predicted metal-dependent hydrolase